MVPLLRAYCAIALATVMLVTACGQTATQTIAVPLNDYARLGQRFTTDRSFQMLWVQVPSWSDNEGGLTLTLWDSPERKRSLGSQAFTDIRDNARVELRLARPLPPGTYYWEVSERTGTTRVGLYAEVVTAGTDDCAYFDGVPYRERVFRYGLGPAEFLRRPVAQLAKVLRSDVSVQEKSDACRLLAIVGTQQAVVPLAELLGDPALAHMARHALEPMPYPSVDAAFRKAVSHLQGALLVGVINSIGFRRDAKAVPQLAGLLGATDTEVALAAAAALGRIGTSRAADALEKGIGNAPPSLRPGFAEAAVECARHLASAGSVPRAVQLYRRLLGMQLPEHLAVAALQGLLAADRARGAAEVVSVLEGSDGPRMRAALWVVSHELPGTSNTARWTAGLVELPDERAALLAEALGHRGDPAAVDGLLHAAEKGGPELRKSAIRALGRLGGTKAISALVALVRNPEEEVSKAASAALADVPLMQAEQAAASLLNAPDGGSRLAGIEVVRTRGIVRLKGALIKVARENGGAPRRAAIRALQDLTDARDVPSLLALLPGGTGPDDLATLESTLTAAASRGQTQETAEAVLRALETANDTQQASLLRVLGAIGGPRALEAVRARLGAADATLRSTALDVLCDWPGTEAVPVLLELARKEPGTTPSLRCVRSLLRLAASPDSTPSDRLAWCREVAPLLTRAEERRVFLAVLGNIADTEALRLAERFLNDSEVREEASMTILNIIDRLPQESRADPAITALLRRIVDLSISPDITERARGALSNSSGQV